MAEKTYLQSACHLVAQKKSKVSLPRPFDSRSFRTRLRGGRFSKLKVSRTLFRTKCNLSQPASFIRNSILRPTISSYICNTQGTFLIRVFNSSCESTSFEMTYREYTISIFINYVFLVSGLNVRSK